jgi:hypothetical protein
MTTNALEGDLMEAMNAALEDSEHEHLGSLSGHSSLRSVDVMDEAMNLLLAGADDIQLDGGGVDGSENDGFDDVEEIDFGNFLESATNKITESKQQQDAESNEGEEKSDSRPPSVVVEASGLEEFSLKPQEPQVVPVKQFENALALIQDLENQIHVLETDKKRLLEENEQLRETTNKQATVLADMEAKLERFPKLLEQTVQEEANLAAAKAESETKVSFWRKDMARQEQEYKEEQLKKTRGGKLSTESLKQSDFLKDIVDRKDLEQSPHQNPLEGASKAAQKGAGALLMGIRRTWNNRTNNHHNHNRSNNLSNKDPSKKDGMALPLDVDSSSHELVASKSHESDFTIDDDSETNNEVDDIGKDSKVLDLMT